MTVSFRHFDKTGRLFFHYRNPSVHHALVGDSAVVLHWQGTDSNMKPMLITNSDGMSQCFIFGHVLP